MSALWLFVFCAPVLAFLDPPLKGKPSEITGDVGDELILTSFIEAGEIEKAKTLSLVPPLAGNVTSYSGYLTVNKTCGSNMFFWYFPAASNNPKAPFVVWLQGGPGFTGLYGLFVELGPYELTPDNQLILRNYTWSRDASVIFFDNPVGTGYSYTEKDECYAKDEIDVGRDLLNALKQILKLFPEQADNPLFVTGESYGGKYVPALSYAIHKDKDTSQKINLQGLAIGNGIVDPYNQLLHYDYLYQLGLADDRERSEIKKMEEICQNQITNEQWVDAYYCLDKFMNGARVTFPTYFTNISGYNYIYNYLYWNRQPEGDLVKFVTTEKVRKSIHVGNATWNNGKTVETNLLADVMKSIRPWVEELVEHYRVLMYTGQLDLILPYPPMEAYLQKMKWSGAEEYKNAKRHIWWVDEEVAGYSKSGGKLTDVLIRNAGHIAPRDQPKWAFDMIYRFFENKPFY